MEEETKPPDKKGSVEISITDNVAKIKNISDSLMPLIGKDKLTEDDLSSAFALADQIQEACEEIIALLFELRDIRGL